MTERTHVDRHRVIKRDKHFMYRMGYSKTEVQHDIIFFLFYFPVTTHGQMSYDLQRLKLLCEEKLCEYIDVSSVATILTLAEQHKCCGLKEVCFEFLKT